ncbi:aminotransferase class V-fold PLP-dependent enzyme [Flammeovirgaceae bacterium SG7u.111]|nr:aminotransferase class V-fold PLP-dependent enzyme [Flammeovirgaceae bacterium SG7u.132]WPO38642.1 aminotransferase class V-fold PLP-dependent enzyme [Flammeovirgaceae bacterium SG7u.111]
MNRADFILQLSGLCMIPEITKGKQVQKITKPNDQMSEESFWEKVRSQFNVDNSYIDLRAHAASPIPSGTFEEFSQNYGHVQSFPSIRNHEVAEGNKELLRVKIAKELNCSFEEVALMRSTTEALNNALMGFPFENGDEVLASVHEYDSMMGSLYQRQKRDGIEVKRVEIPYQPTSKEQIIECFKKSATPKTKLILISHMVWISGQIYPIEEICQWARSKGIATVVDAAQSFSHLNIDVTKISCDYLGASLHKWCAAPLGSGFLYIRKENIPATYPLFGHYHYNADAPRIEKFENFGSITPVFEACNFSLDFWEKIGYEAKRNRMQILKEYWINKLSAIPEIEIVTNIDAEHSCGIAYFSIENQSATDIKNKLFDQYKIVVQSIENYKNSNVDYQSVNVIGIATPVFILPEHLDVFADGIKELVST